MSRNRKMEGYGKRFLTVLLTLAMIVSLTPSLGALTGGALGAQEVYATADPVTGVKLEGDTLSWDPYPGAASYSISYANNRGTFGVKGGATSVNLKEQYRDSGFNLPAGTYTSNGIVAHDSMGRIISTKGEVPDYYYDAYGMTQLDTPKNLRLETTSSGGHRIACDPVSNATSYNFSIGQGPTLFKKTSSTPYVDIPADKESLYAEGTNYTIRAEAAAEGYVTSPSTSKEISGWYGLPPITGHIEGDYFYYEPFEGAANYSYGMSSFGGYARENPLDLRYELTRFNKPAGTYTLKFYAMNENGARISKAWEGEYVFDGEAPSKYAVSFATDYGTAPATQYINKGQTATQPAEPVDPDDNYQFIYWYNKSWSIPFDFTTPITEPTQLTARWYEKVKSVSITPGTMPAEGVTGKQAVGTSPENTNYRITNQYYISGNTGKTVGSDEAFEGGCEYLWITEFSLYSYKTWDDLDDIEIAVPSGMTLFNKRIDDNGRLHVTYSFRTEGSSSLEIVEVSDVTIRTTAANPSGTTGKIRVTNTSDRKVTVDPAVISGSGWISISPTYEFSLDPGSYRDVTVTPKSGTAAGQYIAQVRFTTGSNVQRTASVSLIVEGEATHEMSLKILDADDNVTEGTVHVSEGYPSTQASGWHLWLKSAHDVKDVNVKLLQGSDSFNIGQVLSGWYDKTLPFDYDGGDDLVINIYPDAGLPVGTYHVTAVITGYELKPVTADLTFVVDHIHTNYLNHYGREKPTCTASGMEEYWECSYCHKIFRDANGTQEVESLINLSIPCLDHTYGDWVVVQEPTHSSVGTEERTCSVCGVKESAVIPATPCTVTFENNGHGQQPEAQELSYGTCLYYVEDPTEAGWTFLGWYTDPDFWNPYDWSEPVRDDMTLYAKWERTDPVKSLEDAEVESIPAQAYTMKKIEPNPKVKVDGTVLTKDTDYTLKYNNNINPGTATVTITGNGAYTGTKKVTFKINSPATAKSFVLGGNTMNFKQNTCTSLRLPSIARPYQLSLTARFDKQMLIQWTDCKKLGADIDGYLVMRRVGSEKAYTQFVTVPATRNYYYDNSITKANTNYYYIVLAYKKGPGGSYIVSSDSMSVVGIRYDSTKINPHECPASGVSAALKAKFGMPTINAKNITLKVGQTYDLKLTYPKLSFSTWTRWRPDNSKIAGVNSNGRVTARSEGTTLISGRTPNGRDVRCTVTVVAP